MFRKIHSNRDPKDTLASELRKTFKPYIEQTSVTMTRKMKKHPKLLFALMLISMVISAGLSFTMLRNHDPAAQVQKPLVKPVITDGFDQISHTAAAIQKTIGLKNRIDSLSRKPSLTRQDSTTLEQDLDLLRQLQKNQ
jgi:hypothetical protein